MTQNARHTSGPWKLIKTAKGWLLKTKDGCVIGGINRFPDTAEMASQCEPNAKLAVTAPELLEALEGLEAVGYLNDSFCAFKEGSAALAKARAALAKARVA